MWNKSYHIAREGNKSTTGSKFSRFKVYKGNEHPAVSNYIREENWDLPL